MIVYALMGALLALITALPFAWKWSLGLRRVALFMIATGILCALAVVLLAQWVGLGQIGTLLLVWLLTLAIGFSYLAYRFYRDPERQPPAGDNLVVSPADGEVLYVRESRGGALPVSTKQGRDYCLEELTKTPLKTGDAVVIGIAMSFLDVHVNRAPLAGRVVLKRHFPGKFGSLRRPEMVFENERATTIIRRDDMEIAVVQIASRLVRQIVSFVGEGQNVNLGQRIGVIRLGSQVDVVLPARAQLQVKVKVGDRVRAGESVIAKFEK